MFLLPFAVAVTVQADVDPMRLEIGRKGQVTVPIGALVETKSGKLVTVDDVAKAADRQRFVFLGENHATTPHQEMESEIIEALVRRGRNVVVGLEMYTRPKQEFLDQWSQGSLQEADFLDKSDWKTQWGFDFSFYRPVFESVRDHKLPFVALNVPRDWVRAVGRQGYSGLTEEWKRELPSELYLGNKEHRQIFEGLMGGHPMTGTMGDNIYAAQVLWDEGMADTAVKWLDKHPSDDKTVFVVIAGSGHVLYGQGINYRVRRRTKYSGPTVIMAQDDKPAVVSRGVGDFVFVSRKPVGKGEGAKE